MTTDVEALADELGAVLFHIGRPALLELARDIIDADASLRRHGRLVLWQSTSQPGLLLSFCYA